MTTAVLVGLDAEESEHDDSGSGAAPHVSLRFRIAQDAEQNARFGEAIQAVVTERNQLAHHLLERWDSRSLESTQRLMADLEEQRDRQKPVFETLLQWTREMEAARKQMGEFLASDACRLALEQQWLLQSPIVQMLEQAAAGACRPDGWCYLSTAGHLIHREFPEHLGRIKAIYGHPTLKEVARVSGLFELRDEPTAGGYRTLYRSKVPNSPLPPEPQLSGVSPPSIPSQTPAP